MSDHVSPQSDAALEVRRLSIKLPSGADREMAVDGVSFIVPKGKTLCIVGESGSGKSMIANAVIGLLPPHLRPTNGQILLAGQNILNLAERELRCIRGERIGMIFQEPMTALNPLMRIGDQIGEVFDAHVSIDKNEKRQRILRALTDVGLPDPAHLVDSFPFRLSGGQRQRVMIAGALALEPALLIADEPTTALDVTTQAQILQLIRDLQSRRGTAVLFITHDFGVVSQIADEVVVMNAGIPVEVGPCSQVLATPRHEYTKKLIAAIPNGPHRYRQAQPKEQPLLEVESLCKTFRSGGSLLKKNRVVQAAKNISFTLQRGDTLGIVGESGSGKSTLGRCLVGLSEFDGGKILFDGKELRSGRAFRKDSAGKVQMVFQDPYASLNPRHLVGDAIAEGPIAQGIHVTVATKRAAELLQLVGLTPDAARRYPHEFSGGQRQRIGIARALSTEPQLLIADEPVSALDVRVQAQVLELFLDIQKRLNLAMVFITHDLRVAGALCDRIAVMKKGEIVEYGDTRSVLGNPQHPYTKDLIAAVPKLHRSG